MTSETPPTSEIPSDTTRPDTRTDISLTGLLLALYASVFLWAAWVTEDAYITFRTVDNFVNGYGLTWNTFERVQVYTHPLWMFLMSGAYALTGEMFYTAIGVSFLVSITALGFLSKLADNRWSLLVAFTPLILSKAFMDFSSSGLENPLVHLFLALFAWLYLRHSHDHRLFFQLVIVASLSAVTRLDSILLYVPALIYLFWKLRGVRAFFIGAAGTLPLIAWLGFSTIYYGFPFPNTAYAKLSHGIPGGELMSQGVFYLFNSLIIDPVTLLTTLFALALMLFSRTYRSWPLAFGIILSIAYVVRVGGDYMSGRFLTPAFFLAMLCLASLSARQLSRSTAQICTVAALLVGFFGMWQRESEPRRSVTNIFTLNRQEEFNELRNRSEGIQRRLIYSSRRGLHSNPEGIQRRRMQEVGGAEVTLREAIGGFGYYAGPEVRIVDRFALADPLLARLPTSTPTSWFSGHFGRTIPDGYIETLESGENVIADPQLAEFYERLKVVTQGDIFSRERFAEIWRMNTGKYRYLLEPDNIAAVLISEPVAPGTLWYEPSATRIYERGIDLLFDDAQKPRAVELSLKARERYALVFSLNGHYVGAYELEAVPGKVNQLARTLIDVPVHVQRRGFDTLHLRPLITSESYSLRTGAPYALGHVRLIDEQPFRVIDEARPDSLSALLDEFARPGYAIFFSVKDEASANLPGDFVRAMETLGSRVEQLGFRGSYAAAIIDGELRSERVDNSGRVRMNVALPKHEVNLLSAGGNFGNVSEIRVADIDVSPNERGFNVAVLDLENDVLSRHHYDTYSGESLSASLVEPPFRIVDGLQPYTLDALIEAFAQPGHAIFIAAKDNAATELPDDFLEVMAQLGSDVEQLDYRGSYAAAIIDGNLVAERVDNDSRVSLSVGLPDYEVSLVSAGFTSGNTSEIRVADFPMSLNRRGLNIVVLDLTENILQRYQYDTHSGGNLVATSE